VLVDPAGLVAAVEKCDLPVGISLRHMLSVIRADRAATSRTPSSTTSWLLP
jgi:hypothetical protein